MSAIVDFINDILDELVPDTPEEAREKARTEAEAKRNAEAEARKRAEISSDFVRALPQLRKYTRIAATCLGTSILRSPQAQLVPARAGSRLDHLRQLVRLAFRQYRCAMPLTKVRLCQSPRTSQATSSSAS